MIKILPFDEGLKQREILPYDPIYKTIYQKVKFFVETQIDDVDLHHIGSTAIPDLRGKPMIDILAITSHPDLRKKQAEFENLNFHRRDVWTDTDEKPYICGSILENRCSYNINIHLCHTNYSFAKELLAFVATLKRRADLRRKYELAKDQAHKIDPKNPEIYNKAKESVILEILAAART